MKVVLGLLAVGNNLWAKAKAGRKDTALISVDRGNCTAYCSFFVAMNMRRT